MKPLGSTDLKRLHREWRRRTDGRLAVMLDSVQTPFNVGSIVRTSAAERVDRLWLVGSTASLRHPQTRKSALGSDRYLAVTEIDTVAGAVAEVRAEGYRLVGVELADGAVPLFDADLAGDVCLALGHEDRGLSAACLAECDTVAFIPQLGRVGSLNVATAAAIAVYETRRRSWAVSP